MSKRLFRAGGAAALLLAGALASPAFAKPPDLPVTAQDTFAANGQTENNNYEVPPAADLPIPDDGAVLDGGPTYSFTDMELSSASQDAQTGCPYCSAAMQQVWQALCDVLSNGTSRDNSSGAAEESDGNALGAVLSEYAIPSQSTQNSEGTTTEPEAALATDTTETIQRLVTARRMYLIGQHCLHKGNLDMAYNCFQEVHLLAPTSRYGRRAIARLSEIESRKTEDGTAEQQESGAAAASQDTPEQGQEDTSAGRAHAARTLYHIGQRCQKNGDLDMAVNCYREAQALCPGTSCARRAQAGLARIEAEQAADEAAEPNEAQEPAHTETQDNSSSTCPQAECPAVNKPVKKKPFKGLTNLSQGTSTMAKPQLDVIEQQSAPPASNEETQDETSSQTLPPPLYVSPPARGLVIKQVYPPASDE